MKLDGIDGIRAVAMTPVIAQHRALLPLGWTGAWMFDVISGHFITREAGACGREVLRRSVPANPLGGLRDACAHVAVDPMAASVRVPVLLQRAAIWTIALALAWPSFLWPGRPWVGRWRVGRPRWRPPAMPAHSAVVVNP